MMVSFLSQFFKINKTIEKFISKVRQDCQAFAEQFFKCVNLFNGFDDSVQVFQQSLRRLVKIEQGSALNQILLSSSQKLKNINFTDVEKKVECYIQVDESYADESAQLEPPQQLIIKKEREMKFDQDIQNQQKEARSNFFTNQITKKIDEVQIKTKIKSYIHQLFSKAKYDKNQLQIELDKLGKLKIYKSQIQQLKCQYQQLQESLRMKKMFCPSIQQIIRPGLVSLRVIRIQYQLNELRQYRYSISSFRLFEAVARNKNLIEVIIRGVKISQLQKFIKAYNSNQNYEGFSKQLVWINNFNPSKSLYLTIEADLSFRISRKAQSVLDINNLASFTQLFGCISNIQVTIQLEKRQDYQDLLFFLFDKLKLIHKIRINVLGDYKDVFGEQFAAIFQKLAQFEQIDRLEFKNINFIPKIQNSHLATMQESLKTIFQNNAVTHFALIFCEHFPILPIIPTLQSIYLQCISFRTQFDFLSELTRSDTLLHSFQCNRIQQKWAIDEKHINQIQYLQISNCKNIAIDHKLTHSHSPSNIKHLSIENSFIGNVNYLSVIFPKLFHLTSLHLSDIDFGDELFFIIPSLHLRKLSLFENHVISDNCFKTIDKKWPQLKHLIIKNCSKLTQDMWTVCEFKGLDQLKVDVRILGDGRQKMEQLRRRGIKVDFYSYYLNEQYS